MSFVVKRNQKHQPFDSEKLKKSLFCACVSVHEPKEMAEKISDKIAKMVVKWQKDKNEITSEDIRKIAGKYLSQECTHAGYVYLHHRIMW